MAYEKAEIEWADFQTILTGLIQTDYESVVAELIDNSIDANADNVWVEYFGSNYQEFATIVYDDGDGFISEDKLKKSFNLGGIDDKGNRIGKYNIGMKLTPLSRCDSLSVFCKLDNGKIIHRGTSNDLINSEKAYGTTADVPKTKALKHAKKVLNSSTNNWRTAVVLYKWYKKPKIEDFTESDKKAFARDQKAYFGLIYQRPLEKGEVNLFFNNTKRSGDNSGLTIPLDPFWSNLTPKKIDERINMKNDNPLKIKKEDQFLMKCFREWGTIATPRVPVVVDYKDKEHIVYVTGYVIPAKNLHPMIPTRYKKNIAKPGDGKGPKQEVMGGLWFYRGDRCICFGPTRVPDSNEGWYTLHGNVESYLNKTRVKVEFPKALDEYLNLSPTKDSVDPSEDFLDKVESALSAQISDNRLRAGLGNNMQFFRNGVGKKTTDIVCTYAQLTTSDSKKNRQITKDCPHCKTLGPTTEMRPWHHKDTICPAKPCDVCGGKCELDDCEHECSQCEEIGEHNEENCPLNCEYCEYPEGAGGHGDEVCPKLCNGCGNPAPLSCKCDCPEGCGNTVSECICGGEDDDPDEEEKSFLNDKIPGVAHLILIQGDSDNQKLIQKALKHISEE